MEKDEWQVAETGEQLTAEATKGRLLDKYTTAKHDADVLTGRLASLGFAMRTIGNHLTNVQWRSALEAVRSQSNKDLDLSPLASMLEECIRLQSVETTAALPLIAMGVRLRP